MIFVTGASSGIGAACARAYARKRRPLILWARRRDRLEALTNELRALGAPEVEIATVDVRDRAAVRAEIAARASLYARVEIFVNNAGLAKGLSTFQDTPPEAWEEMIDTNLTGALAVTHALLPHFIRKNSGHVVNMGSVAGHWIYPKGHVYCATKAAIRAMNEALRLDLSGTAIRVTEIAPGAVETEFSQVRFDGDAERAKSVYRGFHPLSAEDIAQAVVWCTECPPHMNVQEIVLYPVAQASPSVISRT